MATKKIKKMGVKEFRELGLLQEVNRKFLHPMGLALEVVIEKNGKERFGRVWDYRDDPEGMAFAPGIINPEKAKTVRNLFEAHRKNRMKKFGWHTQPVKENKK